MAICCLLFVPMLSTVAADEAASVTSNNAERLVVWNGDTANRGGGCAVQQNPPNNLKAEPGAGRNGSTGIVFHAEGAGDLDGLWNWLCWNPTDGGADISNYRNFFMWIKVEGVSKPPFIDLTLNCSNRKKTTRRLNMLDYVNDACDGNWHEIVIPMQDLSRDTEFDPKKAWGLVLHTWSDKQPRNFTIFIDEIGFDNRNLPTRDHAVVMPVERAAAPMGKAVKDVTAEVDNKAEGAPISPCIYGCAYVDTNWGPEAGLTISRSGGNPGSTVNWKKGFWSSGGDWYFVNNGSGKGPGKKDSFFLSNKKAGIETYFTIPIMGRVAKDGISVAFDIRKYPDQTGWEAKEHPNDNHPYAGNGWQYVRDEKGEIVKDDKGRPKTRAIEADPDDTSIEMSPDEQCELLSFMINEQGNGTADKGGLKFICLDNEPMIWHATHRGMHPKGCSYDEYWERTAAYAGRLKKIDPAIKIAGPALWGWTAYFYSGLDSQLVGQGKGTWQSPEDYTKHGKEPFTRWWLKQLREYEQKNGVRLVDILDWHFYPQKGTGGPANDPKSMEERVQETRVLWDPDFVDGSWMGVETKGVIQVIRLMKKWIAECNPGMMTAIGEYNFGGNEDASGGITQAEILGIFAREGLDFGFVWGGPGRNTSSYFGFKMFRNPDGKRTAFGDRYLPAKCSDPCDVSVHAARDTANGVITFVLINKRISQGARLTLNLAAAVPEQEVPVYEYSTADKRTIGKLPPAKFGGNKLQIQLPPMSVMRFDLKTAANN